MNFGAAQERLQLTVAGRVQGVGFRYSTLEVARRLSLVGWVRNTDDGGVEIIAEGARSGLERLAAWCHEGPRGARVAHVAASWTAAAGEFTEFRIRR